MLHRFRLFRNPTKVSFFRMVRVVRMVRRHPHRPQCIFLCHILLEEILHQLIGSLSHCWQGLTHSRWCRISSINSKHFTSVFSNSPSSHSFIKMETNLPRWKRNAVILRKLQHTPGTYIPQTTDLWRKSFHLCYLGYVPGACWNFLRVMETST